MLLGVAIDNVRCIFEFLDLESIIKCRLLCKSIKDIIDYDSVIQNRRKKLTDIQTENEYKSLKQQLEPLNKLVERKFDHLNLSKIELQPPKNIQFGDHLWIYESRDCQYQHAIVVYLDREKSTLLVMGEHRYEEISLKKFEAQGKYYRLEYKCLDKLGTCAITYVLKSEQKPKRNKERTGVQFAFYCKTGKYLPPGKFDQLIKQQDEPKYSLLSHDTSYVWTKLTFVIETIFINTYCDYSLIIVH
ncbi:MAG: F-box protein [Nitrososphaerota archaeon]